MLKGFGCAAIMTIIICILANVDVNRVNTWHLRRVPHGSKVTAETGHETTNRDYAKNDLALKRTSHRPTSSGFRSRHQSRYSHPQSRDTLTDHSHVSAGKSRQQRTERFFRILAWTVSSPNAPFWHTQGQEEEFDCGTPIPCRLTNDRSLYNSSDAVLFHTREVERKTSNWKEEMPTFRRPHQHWITYLHEAPTAVLMFVQAPYHSWFNWTLTYSMKGDMVKPYGICLPNHEKVVNDRSSITDVIRLVYGKTANSTPWLGRRRGQHNHKAVNYAHGKTGLVFWAVGHCKTESLREKYVAELKRYITVDIYGGCVRKHVKQITDQFHSHKFYLAFENSICADYITEKTWSRLSSGIVPIVLGGADYKTFLPPHSYIDVKHFSSPKALATYLYKLDKNDTLYNEYFAWRRNYTCIKGIPGHNSRGCVICKFINENINKINTIADVNKLWSPDMCTPAKVYYRDIATLRYNDAFVKRRRNDNGDDRSSNTIE